METQRRDEVRAALMAYIATWNSGDVSKLVCHWDRNLQDPIYVAEESDPFVGWAAIEAYWAALAGADILLEVGPVEYSGLGAELTAAVYPLRWRILLPDHPYWTTPVGGHVRVSAIFAKRDGAWKIIHYVEAPLAIAAQVKKWLELEGST